MPAPDAFPPDLPAFRHLAETEDGRRWVDAVPGMVAHLEQVWQLTTGSPYRTGVTSWVAPATRVDGTAAVLKVTWPHREARGEAAALSTWDGDGAVRLLEADGDRSALLLERCTPGTMLVDAGLGTEHALVTGASVLRRLWDHQPPAGLESVADVTAEWAGLVRDRMERFRPPLDPGLVALGADLLEQLPATATRTALVHGDFNPGNLLAAEREPWLAIDPKPMVGDPGYDVGPLVLQVEPTSDPGRLAGRFRLVAGLVEEQVDRLVAWTAARSVESALWHTAHERASEARHAMRTARLLVEVAGI